MGESLDRGAVQAAVARLSPDLDSAVLQSFLSRMEDD